MGMQALFTKGNLLTVDELGIICVNKAVQQRNKMYRFKELKAQVNDQFFHVYHAQLKVQNFDAFCQRKKLFNSLFIQTSAMSNLFVQTT